MKEKKKHQGLFHRIRNWIDRRQEHIALDKKTFRLYLILRALVIFTAIDSMIREEYESMALCILSLVLFLLPSFFEEKLKIDVPPLFEKLIYLFIFAAEILGEVNKFYTAIPGWDTMLHTINGFLCAAIGFSLVYVLNRRSNDIRLSPLYLSIVAFCFSMTIGVIWEFIEFGVDSFFFLDMQKDFIVRNFGSVTLDPTNSQIPVKVSDITKTIIETASGKTYTIENGYLDIGLLDTMKDLLVNFLGAIVFSVIGYFYAKHAEKSEPESNVERIAGSLMLRSLSDEELKAQEEAIEAEQSARTGGRISRRAEQLRAGYEQVKSKEEKSTTG